MRRIIFRCDASFLIGSGHLMRCRTLGRELQRRGAEVIFVCRRQPGDLNALIVQEFLTIQLPRLLSRELTATTHHDGTGREIYSRWLGCSQSIDADQTLQVLRENHINSCDWLCVDHYALDSGWEEKVLSGLIKTDGSIPQLLVIDDLADRSHLANCLLDQNFFGSLTKDRYLQLVPGYCRLLLGPDYALLSPEYAVMHQSVSSRKKTERVLIFFGGTDVDNCTLKALQALSTPDLSDLQVDVVVGQQNLYLESVREVVAHRPHTTLHGFLPSLAPLMVQADLAIGAGGATSWERACLGLPSLVVAIAPNQLPVATALHEHHFSQLLGESKDISPAVMTNALRQYLAGSTRISSGFHLCDGHGTQRLASIMLGFQDKICLRKVEYRDKYLLFHWANDPIVRTNSLDQTPISLESHHEWFCDGLMNLDRLHFIAYAKDSFPIGQIRFDLDTTSSSVRTSISIDRAARGLGLSTKMLMKGLVLMVDQWGSELIVNAEIMDSNIASQACFDRLGFVKTPVEYDNNVFLWSLSSIRLKQVLDLKPE